MHPARHHNRRALGHPQGRPDPNEALEQTARRETLEETGLMVAGPLVDLGHVDYTRSKTRTRFAARVPDGATPRCASWEVDKAEFIEISRARRIIHPDQAVLLWIARAPPGHGVDTSASRSARVAIDYK